MPKSTKKARDQDTLNRETRRESTKICQTSRSKKKETYRSIEKRRKKIFRQRIERMAARKGKEEEGGARKQAQKARRDGVLQEPD